MAGAMRTVSLRNLAAHKLRLLLTVLSVVLGTSFVAGSLIFTATVGNSFNQLFDKVGIGVDTQITSKNSRDGFSTDLGVPQSVLTRIEAQKAQFGVAKIQVGYTGSIVVADASGKAIQSGGAPSVGSNWVPPQQQLDPNSAAIMPGGRAPAAPNEMLLNESAADRGKLKVGSKTKVVIANGTGKPMDVVVVGIVRSPADSSGYIEANFTTDAAKSLFTDGKHVSTIYLGAAPGTSPEQLKQQVTAAFPDVEALTGDEVRKQSKDAINQFLQIFNYILLSFAAIGLIVGTFIIYNTFSMIVAQRVKELALLRAIGASRRQVTRSVMFEAFVVGLIGSLVGFAIGVGLAAGLQALLSATGSGLPEGSLAITPSSVIACLAVGIIVTMVSAYAPARRASKVAPVEAMRESEAGGADSLKVRTIAGVVLALLGAVSLTVGAMGKGGGPAGLVGLGALLLIIAIVLAAPALSRPAIGVLGVLTRPFGKLASLARTNAIRNPRRTAATAFALTLGLMLVAVIGTLGASFKSTIDSAVASDIKADVLLTGSETTGLPTSSAEAIKQVDGVQDVVQLRNVPALVGGKNAIGTAPSGPLTPVLKVSMVEGAATVNGRDLIASDKYAASNNWKVGTAVDLTTRFGTRTSAKVTGIYRESPLSGPYMLGDAAYNELVPKQLQASFVTLVKAKPGVNVTTMQNGVEEATRDYLTIKVQTPKQFASAQAGTIDQMLTVLYGMLGLSLLIAVLGIINTLALSVVERKREIGMLRAIGMLRKQVRRTIYLESMLISIFGALLGMLVGVAIGWCLVRTFREWIPGIQAVIPWPTILFTLVMAAVVGLLAAVWPAIRAARTKPLEAIADL